MHAYPEALADLREQLARGTLQPAYRAVLATLRAVRDRVADARPDAAVSAVHPGQLDYAYVAAVTPPLRRHALKYALGFHFETFQFGIALAARNRAALHAAEPLVQSRTWPSYRVLTPGPGVLALLEADLLTLVDLEDPEPLLRTVAGGALQFMAAVDTAADAAH